MDWNSLAVAAVVFMLWILFEPGRKILEALKPIVIFIRNRRLRTVPPQRLAEYPVLPDDAFSAGKMIDNQVETSNNRLENINSILDTLGWNGDYTEEDLEVESPRYNYQYMFQSIQDASRMTWLSDSGVEVRMPTSHYHGIDSLDEDDNYSIPEEGGGLMSQIEANRGENYHIVGSRDIIDYIDRLRYQKFNQT